MYIKDGAFVSCELLSNIIISNNSNITSIGESAFSGCYSLRNIKIPSRVTSIQEGTFWGCNAFLDIIIPNGV